MKVFTNLLSAIIVAGWISAIAILSVQNYTAVSVKFLSFESIEMPVGIVLGFAVGVGLIGGAIAPLLWQVTGLEGESYDEEED
ncbi:LapA family protein [Limnofasciculus baicalensis]|uniref:LapA family protein n=1 Tax=Limnofasciculus baicalensis BBK-W-15 TaxID=2699891 RepID=A0AAE3GMN3_9CYAN|nr:LapA family protein [Limnofasciculus baicalensis]MCP2727189.1 LapA family protein [Limnofasciculus baicalensis BBK-W-15]